jgi:hypothetical protein
MIMFAVLAKPVNAAVIIDHTSINQFDQIPDNYISTAANTRLFIRHASVGTQLGYNQSDSGLNMLQSQNSKYNRRNWDFQGRGNEGWQWKINDFALAAEENAATTDVMMTKLCFIDDDVDAQSFIRQISQIEAQYPTKKIVWWTIPIMTEGSVGRDSFNRQIREYVQANNKILFDVADIESHNASGVSLKDNSGLEVMDASISSDGGHFNDEGKLRMAKAFWVMMAKISGWESSSTTDLCSMKGRGDADCNNQITPRDFVEWKKEYLGTTGTRKADFSNNGKVGLEDFVLWKKGYLG